MPLLVVGLNYRTAPVALREHVAIPPYDLPAALRALHGDGVAREAVILSTCNRIECYLTTDDPAGALRRVVTLFSHRSRLDPEALAPRLYRWEDEAAIRHLFRVTAGLDSMILGESEITAQVKQAYRASDAAGVVGPTLHRLFQKALHGAKLLRTRTGIAAGQASIGSIVLALATQHLGARLAGAEALLWGAGKAAETTARHLLKGGIGRLSIVNRTPEKAQDLAALCSGGWLSWEQAMAHLAQADLAVVCTQAPHYVINGDDLTRPLPQRAGRPLLVVDLAVPRNVDPALKHRRDVHLYNIDDLHAIAQATVAGRRRALDACVPLLEEQVRHCWRRKQPAPLPEEAVVC